MTSAYIHPMRYYCDGPRCKRWADASDVELPKGWRERVITKEWDHAEKVSAHFCPDCTPPETRP